MLLFTFPPAQIFGMAHLKSLEMTGLEHWCRSIDRCCSTRVESQAEVLRFVLFVLALSWNIMLNLISSCLNPQSCRTGKERIFEFPTFFFAPTLYFSGEEILNLHSKHAQSPHLLKSQYGMWPACYTRMRKT